MTQYYSIYANTFEHSSTNFTSISTIICKMHILCNNFDIVFNSNQTIEVNPNTWKTGTTDESLLESLRLKAVHRFKANALIDIRYHRVECRDGNYVFWANAISATPAVVAERFPVGTAEAEKKSREQWQHRFDEAKDAADWMAKSSERQGKLSYYLFIGFTIAVIIGAFNYAG